MLFCKTDISVYFKLLNRIPHSHHALEISIGTKSPLLLFESNSKSMEFDACVILPNHKHKILTDKNCGSDEVITILIDANLPISRSLIDYYKLKERKIYLFNRSEISTYIEYFIKAKKISNSDNGDSVYITLLRMLNFLLPQSIIQNVKPFDKRIQIIIEYIDKNIEFKQFRIEELTKLVCLSESRLEHLFKQELGIPIRKYILWKRLKTAVWEVKEYGANFTGAANIAGFSDVSHFSKVYSSMLGVNPSLSLKYF